ncbi:1,4-dihydroxy-2-naphthoyl-CoA synthase [Streptomyces microflavus]
MADEPANTVLYDVSEGLATITINRPDAMNAMNTAAKVALRDSLREAAADPAVRAVLLTATGRAFCVGQDLKEPSAGGGAGGGRPAPRRAGTAPRRRRAIRVAAGGHRQAQRLDVRPADRAGRGQGVGEPLGGDVLEHGAPATADHREGDRRDDHDHREQQEPEHAHLPGGGNLVRLRSCHAARTVGAGR